MNDWSRDSALRFLGFAVFILVWYAIIRMSEFLIPGSPLSSIPDPTEVCAAFGRIIAPSGVNPLYEDSILLHTAASLTRVLEGTAIAVAVGIPSALMMGWNRDAFYFGGTIVEILRPIPPMAWIPIALLLFRFNAPVFIVFLGVVFPIILNVINGVRTTDKRMIEAARMLGAEGRDIIKKVILPATVPSMITGIRTGLGVGWMCIVAAEMVGMRSGLGLGYFIWLAYDLYMIPEMVAGMIAIGAIGWVINFALEILERRLTPWRS